MRKLLIMASALALLAADAAAAQSRDRAGRGDGGGRHAASDRGGRGGDRVSRPAPVHRDQVRAQPRHVDRAGPDRYRQPDARGRTRFEDNDRSRLQDRRGPDRRYDARHRDGRYDGPNGVRPRYDRNRDGRVDNRFDRNNNGRVDARYRDNWRHGQQWRRWNRHNGPWVRDRNWWRAHWHTPAWRRWYAPAYRWPYGYGYGYNRWYYGAILPRVFFNSSYYLDDWYSYDLYEPPYGYVWIRVGPDILLVDPRTGRIIQVVSGAFY